MKDLKLVVDDGLCVRCGLCAKDCPGGVFSMDNGKPEVADGKGDHCIECQHCLAVCPTGALSVFGLDPRNSLPLSREALPSREQMKLLVRGRRSVRQFRDEDVSREVVDELLADTAHAPTGCNDRALTFLVVDDRAGMQKLLGRIVDALEAEAGAVKRLPGFLTSAVASYRRSGADYFFRGAPHLLVVSAAERASCGRQDVAIALTNFELLAQCAGLGTTWCGMLDLAAGFVPGIRDILGIEKGAAFYGMMFGHPAVQYARTVQRDSAASVRHFR